MNRIVGLLLTGGLLMGCGASQPDQPGAAQPAAPPPPAASSAEPLTGPRPIPEAAQLAPTRVQIPAIGVDAAGLEDLVQDDTTEELTPPVDYARAGWYVDGPAPGEPGPAVVAGHVDDQSGPQVFYRLAELSPGDEVRVTRSDDTVVTFRVDAVEQYAKDSFPTDAVYGPQPGSSLRLITCGGSFDESQSSYRDNIVVYASQAG